MMAESDTPGSPSELEALFALAHREHLAGRLAESAAAYRKIIAQRPDIAEAYCNLAGVLKDQGRLDEAAGLCERAVALNPGLFQAYNILGKILQQQGKLNQAVSRFEQVLALRPELAETHNNLGIVLRRQGKLDRAAAHYQRVIALRPDIAEAHLNLGNVLLELGKLDEAVTQFERGVALKPGLAEAHSNLAAALQQRGEFDRALASYDRALVLRPDYAEVLYHRTDLKKFRAGDADLVALESLAAAAGRLPPGEMLRIHFALGKALEDVGDYPRAFENLLRGNALKRSELDYDEAAVQRGFQQIAEVFSSELLDRLRGSGEPSPTPIFVLGMPRSGSTLIEQILASHPQVHGAGELWQLHRVTEMVSDSSGRQVPYPQFVGSLNAPDLKRMGQTYLAGLPPVADGKRRITDKMPMNFLYVGLIHLILPNARIIHTLRDPVDTCVSCFSRLFTAGVRYSYDLAELGRYYRLYHELMAHFRSVLPPGAMLDVSYEDVVDNLEEQARRLIEYCGLPWDDRCLSFHETNRSIATPSNVQVRRKLYRSSVARWRRYAPFLQPLLAELEGCRQAE
jgi:tetratricopeptide (TPR) repeat protein